MKNLVTLTLFLKADAKFAADVLFDSGGVIFFSTGIELFSNPETTQIFDTREHVLIG
jgi:hypothetical protein